ncbi:hypothetical protein SAMN04487944_10322 [Gracilibacillus ureilyticus]|uniref:Uncharacterized protein n=1 Tax=Gracilibacillus ureilyticus TaxID=531814 RepID=A0A1H9N8M1_9BACI|nr:hypothetical protein SAMN04487944_10322 [Gracilibacillus ureilyticus]
MTANYIVFFEDVGGDIFHRAADSTVLAKAEIIKHLKNLTFHILKAQN